MIDIFDLEFVVYSNISNTLQLTAEYFMSLDDYQHRLAFYNHIYNCISNLLTCNNQFCFYMNTFLHILQEKMESNRMANRRDSNEIAKCIEENMAKYGEQLFNNGSNSSVQ